MAKKKATETTTSVEANPNLFFATGEFELPNGDTYVGNYCAHRIGLIWREGHGIYYTKDGQTYEGEWRDDKLVDEQPLTIKFPSGEEYHGPLVQDKYTGAGTYTMDNKMDLVCEFFDNKPKGNLMLIDVNGRIWEGLAGENKALLLLENSFFGNLTDSRGVGKLRDKEKERKSSEVSHKSEQSILSDHGLEKLIFAKSTKTTNDMNFSESKWCQRYVRYITMKKTISKKIETAEGLTEDETKWYAKYQKFKQEQNEKEKHRKVSQKKKTVVDTSLLDAFYSKEFEKSCPPVKVFYPSCDWAPDCYMAQEKTEKEAKEEDIAKKEVVHENVKRSK